MTALSSSSRRLIRYMRREPAVPVIYLVLLVVIVLYAALDPSILDPRRATVILAQKMPLVLVVVGQTIVFLTRGLDLSVAGVVSLTNVVIATQISSGALGITVGVSIGLLVGIVMGATNGALVGFVRLPPIIATLATWSILEGLALYVLPEPGGSVPASFGNFLLRTYGPIPLPLILIVLIPLVVWWPVLRSRLGHAIYAVGDDEEVAYVSGLPVRSTRLLAYTLSGFLAALAAVFITMSALSGDPRIGESYTLNSIAAVVLGGTLLAGGRGGITGPIAGALVLSLLSDILFFAGISTYWQFVVSGGILIVALAFATLSQRISGEG